MKVHAESFMASLFWLMLAGGAVSSCALTGLRAVAPSNAPPTISGRMQPADDALPHQGIAIDGRGYFGHEILAPADGVVVRIRGDHVTIHHGLDSKKQDIYTEHFHVHDPSPTEGDRVKRGQNIGLIGRGKYTLIPHIITWLERGKVAESLSGSTPSITGLELTSTKRSWKKVSILDHL